METGSEREVDVQSRVNLAELDWSGQRLQSRALKGELETLDGYQSEQRHLGNTIKWTQTSDIFTLSKSFEIAEGGNANSKKCNITRVNPSGHGSTRYGSVRNRTMYIFSFNCLMIG